MMPSVHFLAMPTPRAGGHQRLALRSAIKAYTQDFSIDKAVDRYEALLFPDQEYLKKVGRANE